MKIDEPDTPYNYYDPKLDKELMKEELDPEIIDIAYNKDFSRKDSFDDEDEMAKE